MLDVIKCNVIGKILQGDDIGCFVRVVRDVKDTGGYYILQSDTVEFNSLNSYDAWVDDIVKLESFFRESGWEIDWLK